MQNQYTKGLPLIYNCVYLATVSKPFTLVVIGALTLVQMAEYQIYYKSCWINVLKLFDLRM
jgi:hypothetical protein